jgi:gluconate 5-dehydrogenase
MPDDLLSRLYGLSGQTALVTGGSRGIGLEIAQALGRAGAKVAIVARRAEWLEQAERALRAEGTVCAVFAADVADPLQVERVVAAAGAALGEPSIVVNAAGRTWGAPAEEMPPERWKEILDANATGTFLVCRAAARGMIARRFGRILNVASVAGLRGSPPELAAVSGYAASKGAIIAYTRQVAVEWARYGVTVNVLAPGWVHTRMTDTVIGRAGDALTRRIPVGRIGETGDLIGIALALLAPSAAYITGQVVVVDGGLSAT